MSVFSIFSRLKYGSYKDSHRPALYEEVAEKFHVSPQHVYELQQGKKVSKWVDGAIRDELRARAFGNVKEG